jgi:PncC family amidohydrolase
MSSAKNLSGYKNCSSRFKHNVMYNNQVISQIKNILLDRGETIAVAESLTSGHLQVALASAENASKFFQGGITVYNLGQKARHLNIEPIHAESCNCVSEKVAIQMALNVATLFTSDWSVGITGYAAPVPECSVDQPFAYYAICFQSKILRIAKIDSDKKDAMQVQIFFVDQVLKDLHALANSAVRQSSFSSSDLNSISSRFESAGPLSTSPSME